MLENIEDQFGTKLCASGAALNGGQQCMKNDRAAFVRATSIKIARFQRSEATAIAALMMEIENWRRKACLLQKVGSQIE